MALVQVAPTSCVPSLSRALNPKPSASVSDPIANFQEEGRARLVAYCEVELKEAEGQTNRHELKMTGG